MSRANLTATATATAHSNIALAKYWGKANVSENLPAVPSISMTLDKYATTTTVEFSDRLRVDRFTLNRKRIGGKGLQRVTKLLNEVRAQTGETRLAQVTSENNFPTASGLASSASGFAALAVAALQATETRWTLKEASVLARRSSASAARSVYGGFCELPTDTQGAKSVPARQLFAEDHWDVALVAVLTTQQAKSIGSTEGMERSRKTSPNYADWLDKAPALCREVRLGLRHRDLERVGQAMEQSTLFFHAVAMCASPPILYWNAATVAALHAVYALRERGIAAYATMDAGPHVKVLCSAGDARRVQHRLRRVPGVLSTAVLRPGPGVELHDR